MSAVASGLWKHCVCWQNPEMNSGKIDTPLCTASKLKALQSRTPIVNCMTANKSTKDDYHSTLRALKSRGRYPTKSLGQNYMLSANVNNLLVKEAEIKEGDVVLEIGPGTGSLTNALLEAGAFVFGIEKDAHMVSLIMERFGSNDKLKVVQADVTKCPIKSQIAAFSESVGASTEEGKVKVVSNLPFNIATSVLKQVLPMGDIFSNIILLLQEEMALRITASSPGSADYRLINVFVNFYSEPQYRFRVGRSNFFPQPTVDAAVVSFKLKKISDYHAIASEKHFFSMVNSAFNEKRKMLRNSLQHHFATSAIEEALTNLGLPQTARPGDLHTDRFIELYSMLTRQQ